MTIMCKSFIVQRQMMLLSLLVQCRFSTKDFKRHPRMKKESFKEFRPKDVWRYDEI